jgi:geranylgeranyl diphosphate synthase type 3
MLISMSGLEKKFEVPINKFVEEFICSLSVLDDIEDNSWLKMGYPCAHLIFGITSTTQSAFRVYSKAILELISSLTKLGVSDEKIDQICKIYGEYNLKICTGQGREIYHRFAGECPTLEQYFEIVDQKACAILDLFLKICQVLGSKKTDFTETIVGFARYAQIANDMKNLDLKAMEDKKGFAEDFTDGKYSFPIIMAIQADPNDKLVETILNLQTTDLKLKQRAVEHMHKLGAIEASWQYMKEYRQKLKPLFDKLNLPVDILSFIDCLTEF